MSKDAKQPEDLLPLEPKAYAILFALAGKERHGYEIMKYVEEELKQEIVTATLYRHIRYLVDGGLIEESDRKPAPNEDPRRRYYKLTGFGHKVFRAETNRMFQMAETAKGVLNGLSPILQLGGF